MKTKNKYFQPKRSNGYMVMTILLGGLIFSLPMAKMYHVEVPSFYVIALTTLFAVSLILWIEANDSIFYLEPKKYEQQYTGVNKRLVYLLDTCNVCKRKDYQLIFGMVGLDPKTMSEIVTEYRLPTVDEVVRVSYALGNGDFGDRGMLTVFAYLISGEETWLTDTGQRIDKELLNEYVTKYEAEHRVLYNKLITKMCPYKPEEGGSNEK